MSAQGGEKIPFEVETERVLQILSAEIYDSPNAFLRENVQNAYDAILMRCTAQGLRIADRLIDISIEGKTLTVRDDGIGMTESVLRGNFWKAGSSGKKSELAQKSGVIGTFGIGAMANFGVCEALRIETRSIESSITLISSARRADLRIAEDCISLERLVDERNPGTTVVAELDARFSVDAPTVCTYLAQYVRFLPVPVKVNGRLISQEKFSDVVAAHSTGFSEVTSTRAELGPFSALVTTSVDANARLQVTCRELLLSGNPIPGEAWLVQNFGQTLAFRNWFGLAPVPVSGFYQLGGFVNLNILHPTAGREALSRESVQHVATLVSLMEREASVGLGESEASDRNQAFQQYVLQHGLTHLAGHVTVDVLPKDLDVALKDVATFEPEKRRFFYSGQDNTVRQRFGNEQANLFQVSQNNPRRTLQMNYLAQVARVEQVPETTIVDYIPASELVIDEAIFLIRVRSALLDEYFMPDVEVLFATISHGVTLQLDRVEGRLRVAIDRGMPAARMTIEAYKSAREVYKGFVTDFVRQHIYPLVREHVPSATRQGRDALYQRLKQNEELFRYDKDDFGEMESMLADFISGKLEFSDVLTVSAGYGSGQRQEVRSDQVGTVESELPSILIAGEELTDANKYSAAPPIIRSELSTLMKVLTVASAHPKLNNFQMFLAVSDRLKQTEGEFLSQPHTTKVMWGSHRVIYVFSDETGQLSLYYDIKLREALELDATGGAMFPTTTLITQNRIFVPVPQQLQSAFQIVDGAKEFFVRFDTIP